MENGVKSLVSIFAAMMLFLLAGCGGVNSPGPTPTPILASNQWTWENGSTAVDQPGVYGTQGIAGAGNTPGGRSYASTWTDAAGNFWLFGGYGADPTRAQGDLNDLWKYSAGQWTWVSGSNYIEQPGTYGTQGTPAVSNVPGARYQAASWTDVSGNFWLFGGLGIDSTGTRERLNDLWKFSAGQWTWMGGSNLHADYQPGVYGTQGAAAPANIPGGRDSGVSWIDRSGNLWLFGGGNYLSIAHGGKFNDLWMYQP